MSAESVYETSPVKRHRWTNSELDALDEAILAVTAEENPVSLRGVYYRCVSRGVVEKTELAYKRVGRQLAKLRREGRMPWDWIEDGSRMTFRTDSYSSAAEALEITAQAYRRNMWIDSDAEVVILSEKDAISGTVWPIVCQKWCCDLAIARGYSSITFVHRMAEKVLANTAVGKTTWLYQLGDHDPSGLDAWRSFQERLREFSPGGAVECERLAVTPDQIEEFGLLTRPTKKSDTRAKDFIGESVEVDAINANSLRQIVDEAISQHIDPQALDVAREYERSEQLLIRGFALKAAR